MNTATTTRNNTYPAPDKTIAVKFGGSSVRVKIPAGVSPPPPAGWLRLFCTRDLTLFHQGICGYWLCAVARHPDKGWLAQVEPAEGKLLVNEAAQAAWEEGDPDASGLVSTPIDPNKAEHVCVAVDADLGIEAWQRAVQLHGRAKAARLDPEAIDDGVQAVVFGEPTW